MKTLPNQGYPRLKNDAWGENLYFTKNVRRVFVVKKLNVDLVLDFTLKIDKTARKFNLRFDWAKNQRLKFQNRAKVQC